MHPFRVLHERERWKDEDIALAMETEPELEVDLVARSALWAIVGGGEPPCLVPSRRQRAGRVTVGERLRAVCRGTAGPDLAAAPARTQVVVRSRPRSSGIAKQASSDQGPVRSTLTPIPPPGSRCGVVVRSVRSAISISSPGPDAL